MRRFLSAAGLVAMLLPSALASQSQTRLSLQIDNDAFNFWLSPWQRSDDEYTSGVRITYENGWLPWWRSRIWSSEPRCEATPGDCVTPLSILGQDIYNPARDSRQRQRANARPNAGWLYYIDEIQRVRPRRFESASLTLGVTGPPSLAETTQRLAHQAAPDLNRPIDWSRQIQFEPGVIARYEREDLVLDGSAGVFGAQLVPGVAVSAGNVLTDAAVTLRTRLGVSLGTPWRVPNGKGRTELALTAGITGRAVLRDLFLDGNTFRDSPRVERKSFVVRQTAGLTFRYDRFEAGYQAHFDTPMYVGGPAHAWSSMTGAVVFTP